MTGPDPSAAIRAAPAPSSSVSGGAPLQADTDGALTIRQAMKRTRDGRGKGSKRTPSLDETYGAAIRAGVVKIIRRKGRAPRVVFL